MPRKGVDSRVPAYARRPSLAQTVLTSIPDGSLGVHSLVKLAEVSWENAVTLSLIHESNPRTSKLFLLRDGTSDNENYYVEHLRDISCLALVMRHNTKIQILGICDDMLSCGDLMAHFFRTLEGNNSIRKLLVLSSTLTDSSKRQASSKVTSPWQKLSSHPVICQLKRGMHYNALWKSVQNALCICSG